MSQLTNKYAEYHKLPTSDISDEKTIFGCLTDMSEEIKEKNVRPTFTFNTYCISSFQQVFCNLIPLEMLIGYHNHDYYEVNYVQQGTIYEIIGDRRIALTRGSLLLIHPDTAHTLYAPGDAVGINVLMSQSFISQIEKEFTEISSSNYLTKLKAKGGYILFRPEEETLLESDINNIFAESHESYARRSFNASLMESSAKRLLLQLAIHGKDTELFCPGNENAENSTSADIIDFLKKHYSEMTAEKVAARFNYSRRQLLRIIKKNTGSSYLLFVSQLRFNDAAYLLSRTNTPIDEICKRIGLEKTYFFKFFKSQTGISPMQYRKRYRNEKTKLYQDFQ